MTRLPIGAILLVIFQQIQFDKRLNTWLLLKKTGSQQRCPLIILENPPLAKIMG